MSPPTLKSVDQRSGQASTVPRQRNRPRRGGRTAASLAGGDRPASPSDWVKTAASLAGGDRAASASDGAGTSEVKSLVPVSSLPRGAMRRAAQGARSLFRSARLEKRGRHPGAFGNVGVSAQTRISQTPGIRDPPFETTP